MKTMKVTLFLEICMVLTVQAKINDFLCTYEQGNCGFEADATSEIFWVVQNGSTPTSGTGPDSDHTLLTADGHYAYAESSLSDSVRDNPARFYTQPLNNAGEKCSIVSFFYFMYGDDVGTLNVYLLSRQPPFYYTNPVWSLTGNQGQSWREAIIQLSLSVDFRIAFEAMLKPGILDSKGDIAIDDVGVDSGVCDYTPCTQETLICLNGGTCINVTAENDDDFECICTNGWQGIHCESDKDECESSPCQNGATCVHGLNEFECQCDFGYYGDFCEKVDMCISAELQRCENGGTCFRNESDFYCECMPGYEGNTCGTNIDDCATGKCQNGASCADGVNFFTCNCTDDWYGSLCQYFAGSCDFEEGMESCGYTHQNMDWYEESGNILIPATGPATDHTTGNRSGVYVYADASTAIPTAKASLFSPLLSQSVVNSCTTVKFWYYMESDVVGTLNLYLYTGTEYANSEPIWTMSGDQGNTWNSATVKISSSITYSLVFDAIPAFDSFIVVYSYISLDDIEVIPYSCEYSNCHVNPCKNGGTCIEEEDNYSCLCTELYTGKDCIEDSNLCDKMPCQNGGNCTDLFQDYRCTCPENYVGHSCEYLRGSCDFDDPHLPECKYVVDHLTSDFYWTRHSGPTDSARTGPPVDHTTGSLEGFYMYAESTDRKGGDHARISTPIVPGSGSKCTGFDFWYYFYGDDIGELAIYIEFADEPLSTPIWNIVGNGNSVDAWRKIELNISAPNDFKIIFEAVTLSQSIIESDNRGDVAIDDVTVHFDRICDYDICFQLPCQNGGTCVSQDFDDYTCLCKDEFGGKDCDDVTVCQPNPCQNGGVCVLGTDGSKECVCTAGWVGDNCQTEDYCYPNQCENGGTCITHETTFECVCITGFVGGRCETNIDDCVGSPCVNDGTCLDLVNGFECQCVEPYEGTTCDRIEGSCNFQFDLCEWESDVQFGWKRESGSSPNWPLSGPRTDHTFGNNSGFYIFTDVLPDQPEPNTVYRIMSPLLPKSKIHKGKILTLEFFYHMFGSGIGNLNIYMIDGSVSTQINQITPEMVGNLNDWQQYRHVLNPNNDWKIVLEHEIYDSFLYLADMAIDDVAFLISDDPNYMDTTTVESTTTVPMTVMSTKKTSTVSSLSSTITVDQSSSSLIFTTNSSKPVTAVSQSTVSSEVVTATTMTFDGEGETQTDGLSSGAIAGIVIGILAAVCLALTGLFIYRKNKYESVLGSRQTIGNPAGFSQDQFIHNGKKVNLIVGNGFENNLYQIGDNNL